MGMFNVYYMIPPLRHEYIVFG